MNPPGNDIDEQVAQGFSALALDEDDTSDHSQSESEEVDLDGRGHASIEVDSFAGGNEGGGGSGWYQFAPGFKEPAIERFPRILPTVAARPSGLEREKSPLLANRSMSHSRRDPSPKLPSPWSSYNNLDDPLTVALLGSIPRDETPAQRQQRLALEAEARRTSDKIDERLRQERIERGRKKVVKVLLLGRSSQFPFQTTSCNLHPFTPGQTPACARPVLMSCILSYNTRSEREWKSTTLRNLELIYAPHALGAEALTWRAIIRFNLLTMMKIVVDTILQVAKNPSQIPVTDEHLRLALCLAPLKQAEELLRMCISLPEDDNHVVVASSADFAVRSAAGWKDAFLKLRGQHGDAGTKEELQSANILEACATDMTALWSDPIVKSIVGQTGLRLAERSGL